MEYQKPKSASKSVTPRGERLSKAVLSTMETIACMVGGTLGPGGRPVIIEQFDHDIPPKITKDGVTVFKSMGFEDPTAQVIMEAARDAASNTARDAGDGTTTATVLAEALVRRLDEFCTAHPTVSPQRVMRELERTFRETIEPSVKSWARACDLKRDGEVLTAVARVSANGDDALAKAVMQAFSKVGDEGNVTIIEHSEAANSRYEVETIDGYAVANGYEDSCGRYYSKFINDPARNRVLLENPVFVVYHGKVTEIQTIQLLMEKIGGAWGSGEYKHHNVVIVATGWSDSVLGQLAVNFQAATTINVFPLLAPLTPAAGAQGQLHFLQDVSAITGAKLLDPTTLPDAELGDLGPGVKQFECSRSRANIIGRAEGEIHDEEGQVIGTWEDHLLIHVDALKCQAADPESKLDRLLIEERIGKCTGGIARLRIIGSSNGETKEKRDRAEDAVCAVRGAVKHGCLPGGGWALLNLAHSFSTSDSAVLRDVLAPVLREPFFRLLENAGLQPEERLQVFGKVTSAIACGGEVVVYDAADHEYVEPFAAGLLDSTPAVLEALRNSISIASLLGTLGGTVVFHRDRELERREAMASQDYIRDSQVNEADLRP